MRSVVIAAVGALASLVQGAYIKKIDLSEPDQVADLDFAQIESFGNFFFSQLGEEEI